MRNFLFQAALLLLLGAALLASLWASIRLTLNRDQVSSLVFWSVRLGLLGAGFLLASAALYCTAVKRPAPPGLPHKILVVLYSLLLCYLALEAVFMFLSKSENIGYSLAAQTWFRYYWGPLNQYGYRDRPVDLERIKSQTVIVALGDSFTAGQGIESIRDRYTDLLEAKLGARCRVLNLGKNGSDTEDEYKRLEGFPIRPQILILQYFGNDIAEVVQGASKAKLEVAPYANLPAKVRTLVMGSYFLNYVYWQIPEPDQAVYARALLDAYGDPATLARHYDDLYRFVDFSHRNRCPLVVVLFPFLEDLETSRRFTVPIEHFFTHAGAPAIDVATLVANMPPKQRVINSNDGHASKLVHRLVADALYKVLVEKEWVPAAP